ncbi:hypothetical protein JNUCC31_06630 [Paenibacillus sp. JNUCC31]|uniref:hypothetical protein n=1 Tax=Paenibacillus sp. JNUCC-31 TaxID=2777983 RepID=UPI00177DB984|nr:hypothetical protein [Paenibacillus sp. JNUCC-31]QOS80574.1 hypothetical protein JNUCC31_06630 [Paenibacillus sp. JNUCC-31]
MNNFVDKGLPAIASILPAITIILYIIKWFIKSESRTLIDELLDLRITSLWDRFQSAVFLSAIMMAAILSIIFMFEYRIISNYIFEWSWFSLFVVCCVFLSFFWIKTLWKAMNNRFLTGIIITFYLSLLLVPYIILDTNKKIILSYIDQNYLITTAVILSLIFYNFIVLKFLFLFFTISKNLIEDNIRSKKLTM